MKIDTSIMWTRIKCFFGRHQWVCKAGDEHHFYALHYCQHCPKKALRKTARVPE